MNLRICEHIKANGSFCKSPALRGRDYCFFHLNCLGRKLQRRQAAQQGEGAPLELPPLENADAIQVALMQVTQAILDGRLDSKRAGLVLYALQTASTNLRYTSFEAPANGDTVCNDYDALEQDYEIVEYAPELRPTQVKRDRLPDHPNLDSYAEDELLQGLAIAGDPELDGTAPVDAAMKESYANESDPDRLRKGLRIAWASIDVMKARHWIEIEKQKRQNGTDEAVFERPAQPQALLSGLKKQPQRATDATAPGNSEAGLSG